MKILGIDPALQTTGWGIIESKGSQLRFMGCGLIKTDAAQALPLRLASIHEQIADIIKDWQPDTAAVEETFVNKNPAAALKLGQARGVLLAVPALYGIPTAEYSANKIKKSVVGVGHANKDQVGMMIRTLLPSCGKVTADEADALAVAITHAHYGSINKRILEAAE